MKPGIYDNLSNQDYHDEVRHWSSSNLKSLLKDPAVAYEEKILGNRKPIKPSTQNAFDEGSLAHAMILEPHVIEDEFALFPGFRKAGKDWEIFKSANQDKTIISKPQWKRVEGWVDGYKLNKTAVDLITPCTSELSLFGELSGVPIKVRADSINIEAGYIADVKTTAYDTDIDSWKSTMEGLSYALSGVLYASMFAQHFGKPFDFYFIVLGKRDRSCEIYKIGKETMMKGKIQIDKALKIYKECMESGKWESRAESGILVPKEYGDYEIREV